MAVFTKLAKKEIEEFIDQYSIGHLESFNEIIEGIENTNYKIICDGTPYILTVFEKRVNTNDLPFFMDLKLFLNKNDFKCPKPIINKFGTAINTIKNKSAVIISFIEGKKINFPNVQECTEIGKIVGSLHKLTSKYNLKRENSLGIKEWKKIYKKCEDVENKFEGLFRDLKNEIIFIEDSWPESLPSGVIHADLFKDNVFFEHGKITGVIDFYFSCYHFFLYDIAIVVNDWCFEENGKIFNHDYFSAIVTGYSSIRELTAEELSKFNLVSRAAAVRILITRLHDYIFHPENAVVLKKDPYEYYNILKWHQNHNKIRS